MANEWTRRQALVGMGLATAGLLLQPRRSLASPATSAGIDELAQRFITTPRPAVLEVAGDAIARGATLETLLGAVFVAGIREVRPRHVGGKLHCVMMVESCFQLAEASSANEAWHLALWNLDDFKASQARDARGDGGGGNWVLPPRPSVSFENEAAARREFEAGMDAWDSERADRAIVGLLPFHDRASLFEILWPLCARSFTSLGHKIIFGAQVERVLRRIPWEHAESASRSLVHGLLHDGGGRGMETYDQATALAPSFPAGWLEGKEAAERSAEFLAPLRACSPAEAQQLVVEQLRAGLGPNSIWDGLRLFASELCLRGPSLLPVHAVTEVNAFGHAWRATKNDKTKRTLLLQAAGWMPVLRDALDARGRLTRPAARLDSLGADDVAETGARPSAEDILAGGLIAEARVLLDSSPKRSRSALEAGLRTSLVRAATQSHQHKYAAAVHEDSRLVHPRWTSRILAPALGYLPGSQGATTELHERSKQVLRRVGL